MSSPYLSHTAAAYREQADALDAERIARWERLKRHTEHELRAIAELHDQAAALRREAAEWEHAARDVANEERRLAA